MTQLAPEHEGDTLDVCAQYVIPMTTYGEYCVSELSAEDCIIPCGGNAWADSWLRDKVVSDLLDSAHGALLSTTTGKPATRAADLVADLWKAEGDAAEDLRAELDQHVLDHLDELLSYYSEQELRDLRGGGLTIAPADWTPLDWDALGFTTLCCCPCTDVRKAIRRRIAQRVRSALEIARVRHRVKLRRTRRSRCRRHGRPQLNPRRSPIASNAPPTLHAPSNDPRLRAAPWERRRADPV